LGRASARLLAERGARVVVNDLGGSIDGAGADDSVAASVATEIGDVALADTNDVSTPEGATALIDAALERFGRIDALINNAGIIRWATMPAIDADTVQRHLDIHTLGSFNTTRAAWPHMVEQGYGRVVMTASAGVFGLAGNLAYATAKGAVIGLARTLATEGAAWGIAVNVVAPAAATRMAGEPDATLERVMAPELVAPLVAYLAHESCTANGEIYQAGAGRFARIFLATTEGFVASGTPTVEDVAEHWAAINDETGYAVPSDLTAWSAAFTKHLNR
jgi:NAD(P)-dependent dehydrogenase (short-subunit alcohol dehydrogenase family)